MQCGTPWRPALRTPAPTPDPAVDAALLMAIAAAIRDHQEIRFHYRGDQRLQVEPYRLVSWQRRWYLVARDASTDAWSSFRLDWMRLRVPRRAQIHTRRHARRRIAQPSCSALRPRGLARACQITVHAPAAEVLNRINLTVGVVEAVDDNTCVLVTGADTVETVAVYIGMLDSTSPQRSRPSLVDHLATLAQRYASR